MMSISYVPVMAAKRGELTALSKLQPHMADRVLPLFELSAKKLDVKLVEPSINRAAKSAGGKWSNRNAFLDISKWSPNSRTESGIHVLEYALAQFRSSSVIAHPVIGYDRWGDPQYVQALINIRSAYPITPCIRLDREAIEDMLDPEYFSEQINIILSSLDLTPENCFVMLDLSDVSSTAIVDIIAYVETANNTLKDMGFEVIVVAGGSMPAGVNEAVDKPDAEGCIPRIEMMAWKASFRDIADKGLVFGDYLIRNPSAAEGIIAPHANAKIRYTIRDQHFVVRGHSKKIDSLTVQHKLLAQKLVSSIYFMGASYSWGDSELLNCSVGINEIREPTGMIAIDSNHHMQVVIAEVFEHHTSILSKALIMPEVTK
jgi:hypothetical protein